MSLATDWPRCSTLVSLSTSDCVMSPLPWVDAAAAGSQRRLPWLRSSSLSWSLSYVVVVVVAAAVVVVSVFAPREHTTGHLRPASPDPWCRSDRGPVDAFQHPRKRVADAVVPFRHPLPSIGACIGACIVVSSILPGSLVALPTTRLGRSSSGILSPIIYVAENLKKRPLSTTEVFSIIAVCSRVGRKKRQNDSCVFHGVVVTGWGG